MKAKAGRSSRKKVQPKTGPVKEDAAKSLPENSAIFARLYENSQRKTGWFFTLAAKLVKFYVDKVEPKMKSARARLTRFKLWRTSRLTTAKAKMTEAKQRTGEWLARHKRSLWVTAIVATALVTITILAYLWQRSPAFRTTVKTLGVTTLSVLITLWALLKGLSLNLGEGLRGLGRGLASLGTSILNFLILLWVRLTKPIIKVIVVTRPAGDTVPVPPGDGRVV